MYSKKYLGLKNVYVLLEMRLLKLKVEKLENVVFSIFRHGFRLNLMSIGLGNFLCEAS